MTGLGLGEWMATVPRGDLGDLGVFLTTWSVGGGCGRGVVGLWTIWIWVVGLSMLSVDSGGQDTFTRRVVWRMLASAAFDTICRDDWSNAEMIEVLVILQFLAGDDLPSRLPRR